MKKDSPPSKSPFKGGLDFRLVCTTKQKSFLVRIFLFINFENGQTISLKEKKHVRTLCKKIPKSFSLTFTFVINSR